MDPERWRQIERLYQAALERKLSERDKFIAKACEGETELAETSDLCSRRGQELSRSSKSPRSSQPLPF
jgi:hypothetical protein